MFFLNVAFDEWRSCRHVGVCCPDDIALSGLTGSALVMDLPAGGFDYEESETNTGKLS